MSVEKSEQPWEVETKPFDFSNPPTNGVDLNGSTTPSQQQASIAATQNNAYTTYLQQQAVTDFNRTSGVGVSPYNFYQTPFGTTNSYSTPPNAGSYLYQQPSSSPESEFYQEFRGNFGKG